MERETRFGSVSLVEEVKTLGPGEMPIMHVANEWTRLHLRWRAPFGSMAVELTDDGRLLGVAITGHECFRGSGGYRYQQRLGETALWSNLRDNLDALMATCPRITRVEAAAYRRAFAASRDDYAPAFEAHKRRALTVFRGSLARCVRFVAMPFDPFSERECALMR